MEPPRIGTAFPMLVPQVDADGNGLAGVRMPELAVPLATYTGWNLFNDRSGPTDVLSSMQGSYIPLPRTRAERKRAGDPRPSIEERYRDKDHYVGLVSKAALELIDQGFLLAEDLRRRPAQRRPPLGLSVAQRHELRALNRCQKPSPQRSRWRCSPRLASRRRSTSPSGSTRPPCKAPMTPMWAFFGYDEPNYTYMKDGRKLLVGARRTEPGARVMSARTICSPPATARRR